MVDNQLAVISVFSMIADCLTCLHLWVEAPEQMLGAHQILGSVHALKNLLQVRIEILQKISFNECADMLGSLGDSIPGLKKLNTLCVTHQKTLVLEGGAAVPDDALAITQQAFDGFNKFNKAVTGLQGLENLHLICMVHPQCVNSFAVALGRLPCLRSLTMPHMDLTCVHLKRLLQPVVHMQWLSRLVLLGGIPEESNVVGSHRRSVSLIAHALRASCSSLRHFQMYYDVVGAHSGCCAGEDDPLRFTQKPVEYGYCRRAWM